MHNFAFLALVDPNIIDHGMTEDGNHGKYLYILHVVENLREETTPYCSHRQLGTRQNIRFAFFNLYEFRWWYR